MADWTNTNEIVYGPTTGTGDLTSEAVGVKAKATFTDIYSKLNSLRKMQGDSAPNSGDVRVFDGSNYGWEYYNGSGWVDIVENAFTSSRNTVLDGIISNGVYAILTGSTAAQTVTLNAETTNVVVTFANGFNPSFGNIDYVYAFTANATWTSLPQNSTLYLYADRNSGTGAVTLGYTTVAPVISDTQPTEVTDTHWFSRGVMKVFNVTWVNKQRVFIGYCVTNSTNVTSVFTYSFGTNAGVSSVVLAESAQSAAQTAQGLAQSAQSAAQTAQGLAESAQSAAQTAQIAAENAEEAAALNANCLFYATRTLMNADLAHAEGTRARVTNDSTASNNVYYTKSGGSGTGSWVADSALYIPDGTVTTAKIASRAITAEKIEEKSIRIADMFDGENINYFNFADQTADKIEDNKALHNGVADYNDVAYFVSAPIYLKAGIVYTTFQFWATGQQAGYRGAAYDYDGNYISNVDATTFTMPDNGAYVRFTVYKSKNWKQAMIVEGTSLPTTFIPYGVKIPWIKEKYEFNGFGQKNYFNLADQVEGKAINNGYVFGSQIAPEVYVTTIVSSKIAVPANKIMTVTPLWGPSQASARGSLFDANDNYIASITDTTFLTTPDTAYVRFTISKSYDWKFTMLVEGTSLPSSYIPFYNAIQNPWIGKKIAWYGTSIPAGYPHQTDQDFYSYANIACTNLGAKCLNFSVTNGIIRKAKADGSAIGIINGTTFISFTETSNTIDYLASMVNLIGTASEPDLFVFDYGYNDLTVDTTDIDNFDPDDPYSTNPAKTPLNSRNFNTFIGATNYVIDALLSVKPLARIAFITHYSEDGHQLSQRTKKLIQVQKAIAEYWGAPICLMYEKSGMRNIDGNNRLYGYMVDGVHPASDTTGTTVNIMTAIVTDFLAGIK